MDPLDLQWLKEQREWESVIGYFEEMMKAIQEFMVRDGVGAEDLALLNARGVVLNQIISWAKDRPKRAEEAHDEYEVA